MKERTYVCCDLKSFYASVECVERGLDPMTTNLVVADKRRTDKTICLAVSPSLKAYGIAGRARLFEVVQKVAEVNARRKWNAPGHQLTGSSWHDPEVQKNPALALDYIVAPPRMAHYIDWSTKIYSVYLKYVAPEDIYPYSIDEVFMDLTNYLDTYQMTARELIRTIILDILKTTGITAAAGMGTNLYLAKVAMDIVAKHVHPDKDGVRIAKLNEMTYRRLLWSHRPLTDFWRVGKGYANKLEAHGMYTMGDVARCSIGKPGEYHNEELLYKLFGVNAEILIDHAWGWEPCTIADAKAYKPENNCSPRAASTPSPSSPMWTPIPVFSAMTSGIWAVSSCPWACWWCWTASSTVSSATGSRGAIPGSTSMRSICCSSMSTARTSYLLSGSASANTGPAAPASHRMWTTSCSPTPPGPCWPTASSSSCSTRRRRTGQNWPGC